MFANNFLLGCDPEALVLHRVNGTVRHIGEVLPADGPVGYDHGGRVLELRPEPARSARTLVHRLGRLLWSRELEAFPAADFRLRAGATWQGLTLGGHIHIDLPHPGPRELTPALDTVTRMCERLELLPAEETQLRRELRRIGSDGQPYGMFGHVRDSHGHYEYLTMPSWLYHPRNSFVCLTLAKLAAIEPNEVARLAAAVHGREGVMALFERFAGVDNDARRLVERGFERAFGADPNADLRETWSRYGQRELQRADG